jgi:hypothetical protein
MGEAVFYFYETPINFYDKTLPKKVLFQVPSNKKYDIAENL